MLLLYSIIFIDSYLCWHFQTFVVSFYPRAVGFVVKDDFCRQRHHLVYKVSIIVDSNTITKKTIITYKQLPSRNQAALNQFRIRTCLNQTCSEWKTTYCIEVNGPWSKKKTKWYVPVIKINPENSHTECWVAWLFFSNFFLLHLNGNNYRERQWNCWFIWAGRHGFIFSIYVYTASKLDGKLWFF